MILAGALLLACIAFWVRFARSPLYYQGAIFVAYTAAMVVSGELDYLLPVYFLATALPLVKRTTRYSAIAVAFLLVLAVYTVYGAVFQDFRSTAVYVLGRLAQFLVLLVALTSTPVDDVDARSGVCLVVLLAVAESVIDVFLLGYSTNGRGQIVEGRLIANSQPIGGNIGLAAFPLIAYILFQLRPTSRQKALLLACLAVFDFWAILSGTRGYTIVLLPCSVALIALVLMRGGKSRREFEVSVLAVCAACLLAILCFVPNSEMAVSKMSELLRLGDSTGSRGQENAIALHFFLSTDLLTKIFGIGLGGSWANAPGFVDAALGVAAGNWQFDSFMVRNGVIFHNSYANVLGLQGLLGLSLIAGIYVHVGMEIRRWVSSGSLRICLYMFFALYAISLYFRWSADCGISEMYFLALAVTCAKHVGKNAIHGF